MGIIGIRKEDKNVWERRVPVVPEEIKRLREDHGIHTMVQRSPNRAIPEREFLDAGAEMTEGIPDTPVVFAVKEIPIPLLRPGTTYIYFSHVIKGQDYNMPMLSRLMELGCDLIDYERITTSEGRRLVFFGKEAGQAGMIDTLWALGRHLEFEGLRTPFFEIRKTVEYDGLDDCKDHLREIGERIASDGIPDALTPLIMGFAGYGNVSQGAQEIFDLLPFIEITPDEVPSLKTSGNFSRNHLYKVVFKEEHMVARNEDEPSAPMSELPVGHFDLQEYYQHPERYHGVFDKFVPHITLLMNCIYWEERYPRLVTRSQVREIYAKDTYPTFRVVGDISCDYEGSIEVTLHSTESDHPTFIYDPDTDGIIERGEGRGLTIMAVDNLPAELPREASRRFSRSLFPFIPSIAGTDFTRPFHELTLVPEVKRALILHRGALTPDYHYLKDHLEEHTTIRSTIILSTTIRSTTNQIDKGDHHA